MSELLGFEIVRYHVLSTVLGYLSSLCPWSEDVSLQLEASQDGRAGGLFLTCSNDNFINITFLLPATPLHPTAAPPLSTQHLTGRSQFQPLMSRSQYQTPEQSALLEVYSSRIAVNGNPPPLQPTFRDAAITPSAPVPVRLKRLLDVMRAQQRLSAAIERASGIPASLDANLLRNVDGQINVRSPFQFKVAGTEFALECSFGSSNGQPTLYSSTIALPYSSTPPLTPLAPPAPNHPSVPVTATLRGTAPDRLAQAVSSLLRLSGCKTASPAEIHVSLVVTPPGGGGPLHVNGGLHLTLTLTTNTTTSTVQLLLPADENLDATVRDDAEGSLVSVVSLGAPWKAEHTYMDTQLLVVAQLHSATVIGLQVGADGALTVCGEIEVDGNAVCLCATILPQENL